MIEPIRGSFIPRIFMGRYRVEIRKEDTMALDENKNNPLDTSNVGCLWERMSSKGNTYYTGMVYGKNVIMVANNCDSTKAPAFIFIKPRKGKTENGDIE